MAERSLEERVARLEQRLEELVDGSDSRVQNLTKDWRRTVGMFRGDPIMKEVIDGVLQLREEERRLAREPQFGE
jgi:hypothetical protein